MNSNEFKKNTLTDFYLWNEQTEQMIQVASGQIFGRSEKCQVKVSDKDVSGKHFQLQIENNLVFLIDLGSTNGTFINGKRIKHNEKIELKEKDLIKIGNQSYLFSKSYIHPENKNRKNINNFELKLHLTNSFVTDHYKLDLGPDKRNASTLKKEKNSFEELTHLHPSLDPIDIIYQKIEELKNEANHFDSIISLIDLSINRNPNLELKRKEILTPFLDEKELNPKKNEIMQKLWEEYESLLIGEIEKRNHEEVLKKKNALLLKVEEIEKNLKVIKESK